MSERNQEAQHLARKVVSGGIVQMATERLVYQIVEVCAEHERKNTDSLRAENDRLLEALQTANGVVVSGTRKLNEARARVAKLEAALKQSVELQSHYAELLNMYDGGQRLTFANVEAWLDRLASVGDTPQ